MRDLAPIEEAATLDGVKPRALWVTITKAIIEVAVVVVFLVVVLNLSTVRDHLQAWLFQLTRKTETRVPSPTSIEFPVPVMEGDDRLLFDFEDCLLMLATYSDRSVVFDLEDDFHSAFPRTAWSLPRGSILSADAALKVLQAKGYRVLQQRFPRMAYVVIRDNP